MSIVFDALDCPKNMSGVRQLSLVVSPTIASIRLYHVLVDGGAALNLISLAAFQKLQISMSRLSPSRPFSGVGSGSISLPITFGMPENYRTESILFDVTEVNLPFNAIIGRVALYLFMAITHYEYLVLKVLSPTARRSSVIWLAIWLAPTLNSFGSDNKQIKTARRDIA
jgi:hypothetical protein